MFHKYTRPYGTIWRKPGNRNKFTGNHARCNFKWLAVTANTNDSNLDPQVKQNKGSNMHFINHGPDDKDTDDDYEWSVEDELSDEDEYPPENFPDCDR